MLTLVCGAPAAAAEGTYGVALQTVASATSQASDVDRYNYPATTSGLLKSQAISSSASYLAGPYGLVTGSASAAANLATGELKAFATGSINYVGEGFLQGGGYAYARYFDTLTFGIAGATQATVTPVTFVFESEGEISNVRHPSDVQHIYQGDLSTNGGPGASFTGQYQHGQVQTFVGGAYLASATWLNRGPDHFRLELVYNLIGARPEVLIDLELYAVAAYGAVADFSHTATVDLILPQSATYTSASGVFLADRDVVAGVPEPSTWTILIAGFGCLGLALRCRRTAIIELPSGAVRRPQTGEAAGSTEL